MPQTSPTEIPTIQAARSASSDRSHTPPSSGMVLAVWLASLASVFVGPIPTQVGSPVWSAPVGVVRPEVGLGLPRFCGRLRGLAEQDLGCGFWAVLLFVDEE